MANRTESEKARARDVNRALYESLRVYKPYLSPFLTPPEAACLLKYQPYIAGKDVLDVGVGAGRTTRYLAPLTRRYEGVDRSSVMVQHLAHEMPDLSIHQADFHDMNLFEDESFDFILASDNIIDALSHDVRMRALHEAARVLRPGGILAFSSHNIHHKIAFSHPRLQRCRNPARLAYNFVEYVRCWWNYVQVAPLRKVTSEYALLNDPGNYYSTLHYYAARPAIDSQLMSAGLQLIEVFDSLGQPISSDQDDSANPTLLYVGVRS